MRLLFFVARKRLGPTYYTSKQGYRQVKNDRLRKFCTSWLKCLFPLPDSKSDLHVGTGFQHTMPDTGHLLIDRRYRYSAHPSQLNGSVGHSHRQLILIAGNFHPYRILRHNVILHNQASSTTTPFPAFYPPGKGGFFCALNHDLNLGLLGCACHHQI